MIRRALLLAALAPLVLANEDPLPPDLETEHVVKAGETLGGVAARAEVPRILIIEANRLKAPYALRSGQKLIIPRTRRHTVARGDTRFTISYLYAVPWRDIAVANNLDPGAPIKIGQKLLIPTMVAPPVSAMAPPPVAPAPSPSATAAASARLAWPLSGRVKRGFTRRGRTADYHDGLDIDARDGTAVRASAAGKVLFAGAEPRQFGNLVVIAHGDGLQSAYAFLTRVTVKEGEDVRLGERVGLSGHTGRARGPEVHFEVRRNNRPIDPLPLLPAASAQNPENPTHRQVGDKPKAKVDQ